MDISRDAWLSQAKDTNLRRGLARIWDTVDKLEHGHNYALSINKKYIEIECEDDPLIHERLEISSDIEKFVRKLFEKQDVKLRFDAQTHSQAHISSHVRSTPSLITNIIRFIYVALFIGPKLESHINKLNLSFEEAYVQRKQWLPDFVANLKSEDPFIEKWFGDSCEKILEEALASSVCYKQGLSFTQIAIWEHDQNKNRIFKDVEQGNLNEFEKHLEAVKWELVSFDDLDEILSRFSSLSPEDKLSFTIKLAKKLEHAFDQSKLNSKKTDHIKSLLSHLVDKYKSSDNPGDLAIHQYLFNDLRIYSALFSDLSAKNKDDLSIKEQFLIKTIVASWCDLEIENFSYSTAKILKFLFGRDGKQVYLKNYIKSQLSSLQLHFKADQTQLVNEAIQADKQLSPETKKILQEKMLSPANDDILKSCLIEVLGRSTIQEDIKAKLLELIKNSINTTKLNHSVSTEFRQAIIPMVLEELEIRSLCSAETCRRGEILLQKPSVHANEFGNDVRALHQKRKTIKELKQSLLKTAVKENRAEQDIQVKVKEKLKDISKIHASIGEKLAFSPKSSKKIKKLPKEDQIGISIIAFKHLIEKLNTSDSSQKERILWQLEYTKVVIGQQLGQKVLGEALTQLRESPMALLWHDELQTPQDLSSISPYHLLTFHNSSEHLREMVDHKTARMLELASFITSHTESKQPVSGRTRKEVATLFKESLGDKSVNQSLSSIHNEADFKSGILSQDVSQTGFPARLASTFLSKPKEYVVLPDNILPEVVDSLRVLTFKLNDKKIAQVESSLNKLKSNLELVESGKSVPAQERLSHKELAALYSFARLSNLEMGCSKSSLQLLGEILGKDDPLYEQVSSLLINLKNELQHLEFWTSEQASSHYASGSVMAKSGHKKQIFTGRKLSGEESAIYHYLSILRQDGYLHGAKLYKDRGTISVSHVMGSLSQDSLDLELLIESDVWEVDPTKLCPKWVEHALAESLGPDWKKEIRDRYYKTEDKLHRSYDKLDIAHKNSQWQRVVAGLADVPVLGFSHHLSESQNLAEAGSWTRSDENNYETMICSEFASRSTLEAFVSLDHEIYKDVLKGLKIDLSSDFESLLEGKLPSIMTVEALEKLITEFSVDQSSSHGLTIDWNGAKHIVSEDFANKIKLLSHPAAPEKKRGAFHTGIQKEGFDPLFQQELRTFLNKLGYRSKSLEMSMALITKNILDLPYDEKENFRHLHPNRMVDLLQQKHCVTRKGLPPKLLEIIHFPSELL